MKSDINFKTVAEEIRKLALACNVMFITVKAPKPKYESMFNTNKPKIVIVDYVGQINK